MPEGQGSVLMNTFAGVAKNALTIDGKLLYDEVVLKKILVYRSLI
jgi:hypothetical protein